MKKINALKFFENNKYLEMLPDIKEKKVRFFITMTLTLLALSFFGIFAINPTLSTITELNKKLSDSEYVYQQLEQKISNISQLQNKYRTMEKDIPIIFSAIPDKPKSTLLVGQLQALAVKSRVIIKRINTSPVELTRQNKKVVSSYDFSIELEGDYKNLMDYLFLLANYERITTIDSIIIGKSDKANTLQLNLRGKTYFKD